MGILGVALTLVLIVLLGWAGGWLMSKIKLPKVLGFIIVGMLIGPYAFGIITPDLFESNLVKILLTLKIQIGAFQLDLMT